MGELLTYFLTWSDCLYLGRGLSFLATGSTWLSNDRLRICYTVCFPLIAVIGGLAMDVVRGDDTTVASSELNGYF